jgi:sugar phosphate isomerase/epimerase
MLLLVPRVKHKENDVLIGLSVLSFSYRCGRLGRDTPRATKQPMSIDELISLAARASLQSLEFPLSLLPDLRPASLRYLRELFEACSLVPVADSDVVDVALLEQHIPAAAHLGAGVLRVLVSPVREGLRHTYTDDWPAYLEWVTQQLRRVRPLAEQHNVRLALENHQDVTSTELVQICREVGGEHIGVTFDPVNALAMAESPFEAIERLGPYILNVHLADYEAYLSESGWRLVRCALGEGDLNLRRLFEAVERFAPDVTCQIELTGHSAIHVRLFEDMWWQSHPQHDVRALLPVFRLLAQSVHTHEDWRTPWERGAGDAEIRFYEEQQFASSITYLRTLGVLPRV